MTARTPKRGAAPKKSASAKRAPAKRRRRLSPAELRAVLKQQPLVGLTAAARILGIKAPNVSRLRSQGRMPEGVPVEGSAMVYVRSEVEQLASELEEERGQR